MQPLWYPSPTGLCTLGSSAYLIGPDTKAQLDSSRDPESPAAGECVSIMSRSDLLIGPRICKNARVSLLIAFAFIAVVFLIVAGLVGLVIRLTGRRGRTRAVFKWCGLTYLVGAPAIVFIGFPILMANQLTSGIGTRGFDRALTETPESYGCSFEEVTFPSRDGLDLSGWWMAAREDRPVFVITHGLFRDRKEVSERGCRLNQEGFGTLVFDLRHHGRSGGEKTSLGYMERLDVLGAYDFVRADSSVGVIVMGVSMGATASILALPEVGPDLIGAVADSPFLSLKETIDRHAGLLLGIPAFPFSNFFRWELTRLNAFDGDKLDCRLVFESGSSVPILLVYGEADRRMPRETAEAIMEAIPHSHKELSFFPDASHGAAWRTDPDRYLELILRFVKTLTESR